jgi:RNA polymerase sigma-70 factor (ECF subfamily)
MFLAGNLLASEPMLPKTSTLVDVAELGKAVQQAIAKRFSEAGAESYGVTTDRFLSIVSEVVVRYAGGASEPEQLDLVATLRVADLVLARACSVGNEPAWEVFLTRFRAPLYEAAYRIAKDDATGRELADGLYADLYGMPNTEGKRVSKLDYYMGRGSLEGWLRTVLAQQHVNRHRLRSRETSLDEQLEAGVSFAERTVEESIDPDDRVAAAVAQTLEELSGEERFLLASYYLDERTLAHIGRQLRLHESTVSRKLERLTSELRKRVRKRLVLAGVDTRRCDELMQELDVRDLNIEVSKTLRQEAATATFYKRRMDQ